MTGSGSSAFDKWVVVVVVGGKADGEEGFGNELAWPDGGVAELQAG